MLALPGVGTYTARAVATFAYGQRHPVVDTNVRRVVSRAVAATPTRARRPPPPTWPPWPSCCPPSRPRAARASIAFMELGAIVCTARSPRCADCPFEAVCAWRPPARRAPAGPTRRPQRYAGTDRQVRGLLLEVLRHATGPVPRQRLDVVWADDVQRARALAGLVTDGLVEPLDSDADRFVLAGDHPRP